MPITTSLHQRVPKPAGVQVALTHSFCFPLAEVAVAVASQVPDFGLCLLAKLHQVCPPSSSLAAKDLLWHIGSCLFDQAIRQPQERCST